MKRDIHAITLRDQMEKHNPLVEVINVDRQLWASIQSKGILHTDVHELYCKACKAYENIILNHELVELQDVEYSLWKLHYKHIDEFRKRIRQVSANAESTTKSETPRDVSDVANNVGRHVEGFKLFLSEATEFYKYLIKKFRRCCGLPEELSLYNKCGNSLPVEPTILRKCDFATHRFLVCLGDISRYKELCKKPDIQKWAVAATYYLEATMVWPDSGNPQNKLALLATYIGDDFLALYHSIRSLAVKEPFPDALDNIMLLFEKNRSLRLHSLSSEAHFDFSKPLRRCSTQTKSHSNGDSSNSNKLETTDHIPYGRTDLWPLFVRMTSFFLVKSSLEDFNHTFASTMSEFEALLALDDTKLKATLEPYEQLNSSRKGPYQALQLVSILIFIIHNLEESPEQKYPKEEKGIQLSAWKNLAWTSTFTFLGRFLERCHEGNDRLECCSLLAPALVFVEWLIDVLDNAETHASDGKYCSARSYFFGAFVDLLNQLDVKKGEVKSPDHTALWEDYELRGFEPIAHSHESLDFSTHCENMSRYDGGNSSRVHRIFHAAMRIADRSSDSRDWIFYDHSATKFFASDSENGRHIPVENGRHHSSKGESSAAEEEEVILFKPITRYNSAPIYTSDQMSLEGIIDQRAPSDEALRRATSSFVVPNEAQLDLLNLHAVNSNFKHKQQESPRKDSNTYAAGPPSLSSWVISRESLNVERDKGTRNLAKPKLSPIEEIEMPSASFSNLSIGEAMNSSSYVAPVPSAPLLPEDPVWLRGNASSFSESKSPAVGIKERHGILGAPPPVGGFSKFSPTHGPLDASPGIPGSIDAYPPMLGMSSSEWLYHYTISNNNNRQWPLHSNNSHGNLGNLHGHDASRLELFDRWGNPLVSNRMVYLGNPQFCTTGLPPVFSTDEQRRENLFPGHQRPNLNGCGGGADLRAEQQPPLLQYLKEREWQLQRESPLRGPYMGN